MSDFDAPGEWAPVVYGRTKHADFWWRAVPEGLDHRTWLTDVVLAAVAGDKQLDRPRFLLSRSSDQHILIGVACRVARLSDDMNIHERRKLYGFVGWVAPASVLLNRGANPAESAAPVPALADFQQRWVDWAGPLYRFWIGRDWAEHPSRLRQPHASRPDQAPWAQPTRPQTGSDAAPSDTSPLRGQSRQLKPLDVSPSGVWVLPGTHADWYWQRALLTPVPYALVVGWTQTSDARRAGATHICADDATVHLEPTAATPPTAAPTRGTTSVRPTPMAPAPEAPAPVGPAPSTAARLPSLGSDRDRAAGDAAGRLGAVGRVVGSAVRSVVSSATELIREVTGEPHDALPADRTAPQRPGPLRPEPERPEPERPEPGSPTGRTEQVEQERQPRRPAKSPPGPVAGRKSQVDPGDADYDSFFG
jgi:hypothetical protein